jgi:mRNA interferase YafQ
MRTPEYSTQFQRDVKRCQKRGKDLPKLKLLLATLIAEQPLSPQYKDHPLKNNWSGYRDAHIEPDWLVIYRIDADGIRFERTGTHADIFE